LPASFRRPSPPPSARFPPLRAPRPPPSQFASTMSTEAPASRAAIAAGRPVAPEPMTTTSASRSHCNEGRSFIVVAVVPLVIAVAVRLFRDVRRQAALAELFLELLA